MGIGRFGPYLFYNGMYFSIKDREDYINISHQEAVEIIDKQSDKKAKLLGQNKDGKDIYVCKGRYGFYLKCDKTSVALKGRSEDITLEDAILLLSQKQ
ncbi:DNA topoisomerase I [Anaplasma phagocytophilum]|nr:DNA topoisomerase I [Anaplasma phagocytophilum]